MTTDESSVADEPSSEGQGTAQGGDVAQSAEEESRSAEAESPGKEADPGAIPADSADAYKAALEAYLGGDLRRALRIVDSVLENDPESELRPRLERLRRRADDRISKEAPAVEEPPVESAEVPAEVAGSTVCASVSDAQADPDVPGAGESAVEGEAAGAGGDEPGAVEPRPDASVTPTVADEAVADEAVADEAVASEAVASEAVADEAVASEAVASEAVADEAVADEAVADEAVASEAVADAAVAETSGESAPAEEKEEADVAASAESSRVEAARADESGRVEKTASGRVVAQPEGRVIQKRRPGQPQRPPGQGRKGAVGKSRRPGGVKRKVSPSGSHPAMAPGGQRASIKGDLDRMNNSLNKLANSFRVVEGSVVKVAEAYQRVARNHKRKEQAYDQLYEELRGYKENFLLAAQKPLFKDIILLFDGIRRTMSKFEEMDEKVDKEEVLTGLKHLLDEVLEVLYRRDIELIEERPNVLDIDFQKPVRRVETDNPDEDREIIQVVREGFRMNGTLMRAQEVIVKRCVKERESE